MEKQIFTNGCLEFENVTESLTYFIEKILDKDVVKSMNPKNQETYKKEIIELTHQFFAINNPKAVIFNIKNYTCLPYWIISEILSEMLNINPPIMSNYRKDIVSWSYEMLCDGRCEYLYGGRWNEFNLLSQTYQLLKNNPTSKRAIVPIFTPYDVSSSRNDVPCNTQYEFLLRDNKLDMTIIVRSWDITRGFRYDFSLYSFILQCMASWLGVDLGKIYVYVNSLHCYGDKIEDLKKLKLSLMYNKETLELNLDRNMDITKCYDDMRKVVEFEVMIRNNTNFNVEFELRKLNYKFARDFVRIYLLKNVKDMINLDFYQDSMETSIKSWFKKKDDVK